MPNPQARRTGIATLGASTLDKLIKHPQAREQFGFFKNPPRRVYKRCCGKTQESIDYEKLKRRVGELDVQRFNDVKGYLGIAVLRVVWRAGNKIKQRKG